MSLKGLSAHSSLCLCTVMSLLGTLMVLEAVLVFVILLIIVKRFRWCESETKKDKTHNIKKTAVKEAKHP